jgi:metallo-beta-lactamase family protein
MENQAVVLSPSPTVQFLGAAQTVTGSMHLVEAGSRRVLLDCGLYLGGHNEARRRNRHFPFDPLKIDAVLLTHAHIDHCGNLPNLVRQGFKGPIYCTSATRDLLSVMLLDSAKIQEQEAAIHAASPLYTYADVDRTLGQCVGVAYNRPYALGPEAEFRLVDAGHLLGSAMIALQMREAGRDFAITYTGDLGRKGLPFLRPPAPVPAADLVICESTYGGKRHPPLAYMAQSLAAVIERTVKRGGKVLIPAFSLGRTQIVVHYLQKWMHEGVLPPVPIFVDSPLVPEILDVYRRHPECLAEGSHDLLEADAARNGHAPLHYLHSYDESRSLSDDHHSSVIVASGGMLDGGRAMYHLQQYIDDPRCSIVLVSYQAPLSLGRRLLQRGPTVFFHGRTWNKWADVIELKGFSGHADHEDFLDALTPLVGRVSQVQLVHGELEQAEALAHSLRQCGFDDVGIPYRDQSTLVS